MSEAAAEQEIVSRGYVPAPDQPSWFEARMAALLGRTLDGRPKLRVVWGYDAKGFPSPDPEEPKYVDPDDPERGWACWILEQFVGPEFFGDPGDWERGRWGWSDEGQRVELTAPYPSRGEYVFIMPIAAPSGEPLPLTDEVADFIAELVEVRNARPDHSFTCQQLIAKRRDEVRAWREQRRAESEARTREVGERHKRKAEETNRLHTREYSFAGVAAGARQLATKILGAHE